MGTAAGSDDPKGLFHPKSGIWDKSRSRFGWASQCVRGLGAASIVLLGVVREDAQIIQLKTAPQVKHGERERGNKSRNWSNGCRGHAGS